MKGRPPKSSRQRLLEGNPGRRPIPVEPVVPALGGGVPTWVPPDARRLWSEFLPRLQTCGFLAEADGPMLFLMCQAWSITMQSLRKLKRQGLTCKGRKNPAGQIWRDNANLFLQIASKFGMSPVDRARLFGGQPPDDPGSTLDGNWHRQLRGKVL